MDEDIKLLEELLNYDFNELTTEEYQAIKNLIARNKELEEKNKKLESRKYMLNAETGEVTVIPIDNNYIPKSKVKNIIQKYYDIYEKEKKYRYTGDVEEEQDILREIEKELLKERN